MTREEADTLRFLLELPANRLDQAREALSTVGIHLDPARHMIEPGDEAVDQGIFTSEQLPAAVNAVNDRLADAEEPLRLRCNPRAARPADIKRTLEFLRDAVTWNAGSEPEALAVDRDALEELNRQHPRLATYTDTPGAR